MKLRFPPFSVKLHVCLAILPLSFIITGAVLTWGAISIFSAIPKHHLQLWDRDSKTAPGLPLLDKKLTALAVIIGAEARVVETTATPIFIIGWLWLICMATGFTCLAWHVTPGFYADMVFLASLFCYALVSLIVLNLQKNNALWKGTSEFEKFVSIAYTGNLSNPPSTIDFVQGRLGCCGAVGGEIYADPKRTPFLQLSTNRSRYPPTCCKLKPRSFESIDPNCPAITNSNNSNVGVGCVPIVHHIFERYCHTLTISYVSLLLLLFVFSGAYLYIAREVYELLGL